MHMHTRIIHVSSPHAPAWYTCCCVTCRLDECEHDNVDFEYLQNGKCIMESQAFKIHTIEAHNAHNYTPDVCTNAI